MLSIDCDRTPEALAVREATMRRRAPARLILASTLALACSDGAVEPPRGNDNTPTTLAITGGADVDLNGSLQLDALARNAAGQAVSAAVTWSTSDGAVATVDNAGRVMGVSRGTVTIQAEVTGASGPVAGAHDVSVRIASIMLSPGTGTLTSVGDTLVLTAEAKDAVGSTVSGVPISLSTSDASVATVSNSGAVVAVGNGQAVVTASADGRSQQAMVTVSQVATDVTMPASLDTLTSFGDERVYTATAADARGNAIADGFTWTLTDPSVATATGSSASITATASGNGTTTVQVARDGFSASATIVVKQVVTTVDVLPSMLSVFETAAGQLTGTPQDARGNAVAGSAVSWNSGDQAVATVDNQGVVTGVTAGPVTITATADGVNGTSAVTINTPSLAQHVQPILSANCALSGCHAGGSPAMGQNLSAGQTFSATVNVPSGELPTMDRVEPGDPDVSYLVHKIQGTQASVGGSGSQMPLGGSPLTQAQIDTIRAWIKTGAPNN